MWINILLKAALFYVLVPGNFLSIPAGASFQTKALVHGVVFAIVNYFVYLYIRPMLEGFDNPDTKINPPCPPGSKRCGSGDCVLIGDVHGPCPESGF